MKLRRDVLGSMLFAVSCLFATVPLHADEASKRAKIQEMFVITHLEASMSQMMDQQTAQLKTALPKMFLNVQLTAEQQGDINKFMDKAMAISRESVSWPKVQPQFLEIYANTYSEEEVDGILAFYRSPIGKSMLEKQPLIITRSQAVTQERLEEMQPKMRALFEEFMAELSKKYPSQLKN